MLSACQVPENVKKTPIILHPIKYKVVNWNGKLDKMLFYF